MKSTVSNSQRRSQFTLTRLLTVVLFCAILLGWWRQVRDLRLGQEVLIDQLRTLQQTNDELLLQLNRTAASTGATADFTDTASAFLERLLTGAANGTAGRLHSSPDGLDKKGSVQ